VPSGLSGVAAIAAGTFHSLALKGDGTVVAWGCAGTTSGSAACRAGSPA
jgi:alpha-tubulin suppressor-like RCC1 family protein